MVVRPHQMSPYSIQEENALELVIYAKIYHKIKDLFLFTVVMSSYVFAILSAQWGYEMRLPVPALGFNQTK